MMSERAFRLAIWSALIQIIKALGKYWGLADDIKIIQPVSPVSMPLDTQGDSISIVGVVRYK